MTTRRPTILVAGATGKQGGAVVRHLLAGGFPLRALTRDTSSEQAQALRLLGAETMRGDLTDRASLDAALVGVDGVFAMATPFELGTDAEVKQGTTLGDAAKAAGVKHYLYSSVGGADRHSGVPHFETKWQIEEHLRSLDLPLTIVRPTYFFENFAGWSLQPQGDGYVLAMPLSPERTLQTVAADDIGGFAALIFAAPDEWIGREFELAGDEKTLPQYAEAIGRSIGAPVEYVRLAWSEMRERSQDLYRMYDFFEREGYAADIDSLRRQYPDLRTFRQWLSEGGLRHLRQAA